MYVWVLSEIEKKVFIFVTEGLETQVRYAIYQRSLAGYSLWGHKKNQTQLSD